MVDAADQSCRLPSHRRHQRTERYTTMALDSRTQEGNPRDRLEAAGDRHPRRARLDGPAPRRDGLARDPPAVADEGRRLRAHHAAHPDAAEGARADPRRVHDLGLRVLVRPGLQERHGRPHRRHHLPGGRHLQHPDAGRRIDGLDDLGGARSAGLSSPTAAPATPTRRWSPSTFRSGRGGSSSPCTRDASSGAATRCPWRSAASSSTPATSSSRTATEPSWCPMDVIDDVLKYAIQESENDKPPAGCCSTGSASRATTAPSRCSTSRRTRTR